MSDSFLEAAIARTADLVGTARRASAASAAAKIPSSWKPPWERPGWPPPWEKKAMGKRLYEAAGNGDVSKAKELISSQADVTWTADDGTAALHAAALRGRDEIVQLLIAAGADKDHADTARWTALHVAAGNQQDGSVQRLLDAGANTELTNDDGQTPLQLATECRHASTIALLSGVVDVS